MRTLSLKTTAAKSIFPTFPDCSPHPEPNFHQLRSPANAAPLAPPPTEKPSAPRRNPPPREAREASSGQRAGSYLLMITAPLYMTEKVGIITWSPGGLSRTAGRQQLPQPSASSHMMLPVCAQPASNSTKTDCPLKTSPPSPTRLISYITKVTGGKKIKHWNKAGHWGLKWLCGRIICHTFSTTGQNSSHFSPCLELWCKIRSNGNIKLNMIITLKLTNTILLESFKISC